MKRLLIVFLFIVAIPWASSVSGPAPAVVFAGHTLLGGSCACGCPDCICDPGETPLNCGGAIAAKPPAQTQSSADAGSATIGLLTLFLLWLRLRA